MKILCIKSRGLGDTVLWTSALQALKDFYKDAILHLAIPENYFALFKKDSRFQKVFSLNESFFSITKKLRQEKYSLLLNFHASQRTLYISLLSGAKKKLIHHHSRKAKNFFSDERIFNLGIPDSAIERDLNVLRTLGWQGSAPKTQLFLASHKKINSPKKKILLGVFATRPAKQWPWQYYYELAEKLHKQYDFFILREKKDSQNYFLSKIKASFVETPTLQSLLEHLSNFDLYVGTDSGLKHLCIASGIKTLTLFGPESIGEWHPYNPKENPTLQIEASCRNKDPHPRQYAWCGENTCPLSSHFCLSLITPAQVIKSIETLL